MEIKVLDYEFAVCKIMDISKIDFSKEFVFLGKTDEEISLVCEKRDIPSNTIEVDNDWKCFRIQGVLDFGLVGILAKITSILAESEIPVFAVSTFNTDYILIKTKYFDKAISILQSNKYLIQRCV